MLELKNISKVYSTKSGNVKALDDINLYFEETGMVFITGKSGSGKTTLLNCIGGLDNFSDGEILIKEKSTKDFTKADYDSYRNTYIGFVFQEYNLLENLTISKNISLATELQGVKDNGESVKEILEKVDLHDVENRKPQELSGGQRQRVAIARAIVKNPSIIIADEPTGALDTENGLQILSLLKKLSKEKLVIVVSHDLELANTFADRIINLKDGKVESDITINVDKSKKTNLVEKNDVISIKRGANLKETDLKTIKKGIQEGKDLHVTDNINIVTNNTTIKNKKTYDSTSPFIKTKLSLWGTIKLGLNTLKTKKIRLAITILLCAIAFSVFGIFDAMAIYDEGRLTVNTLKSSITPSTTITTNIKEESGNSYDISVNEALLSSLSSQTGYDVKGVYNSYYIGTTTPTELNNNNACTISKYYYYKALRGIVEFDDEDLKNYNFKLSQGRLPKDFEEIAITEYFANCMVNWWYTYKNTENETTVLNSVDEIINEENPLVLTIGTTGNKVSYKIVGIIDTGKINKKFDSLKSNFENSSTIEQNEFLNYINNGFYLYGFMKPGFSNYAYQKFNTLSRYINRAYAYQFTTKDVSNLGKTITTSRENFYNFDDLKKLTSNYIFINEDKTTLENNEIMIDVRQFSNLYSDLITYLKSNANNNPNFPNHASEIENYISLLSKNISNEEKLSAMRGALTYLDEVQTSIDKINNQQRTESIFNRELTVKKLDTSKYQPGTSQLVEVKVENKTYKIVGFFTGVDISPSTSFVMTTSGMSNLGINLMQGKYSSLLATNLGKGNINSLGSIFLNNSGICYSCKNNAIALIRTNGDFFSKLSMLFLIISGVFAIFSIVMFSNFISTSIKNKYAEIGILRALGARGSDILKMFIVEAVAIAVINAIVACVISAVGCIFVNMFLSNYLSLYIPLASFGIRQILITLGLSILVGTISAIMPIASISKQKPVETIRRAF